MSWSVLSYSEMAQLALLVAFLVASTQQRTHAYIRKPAFFPVRPSHAEMWMSTTELVERHGYRTEAHDVRTPDGYILTAHRIPGRAGDASSQHRTPVLIGHGLGSSDEQWLLQEKQSLPFLLADHGFDVWLGNYRGSFYGLRHSSLSLKSHKFWDFSWHENGVYDQAAMIDYILAVTGRPKLITIGHSMSSSAQVVLLAERPEYSDKILANLLLAPPILFHHTTGIAEVLRVFFKMIPAIEESLSRRVINDRMPLMDHTVLLLCYSPTARSEVRQICAFGAELAMGHFHQPESKELQLKSLGHFPSSASIRQAGHYAQCIMKANFQLYDYGKIKNKQLYGTPVPPAYNLSRITSPAHVFYSLTDNFVSHEDAEELARNIPSLKGLHKIDEPKFNHADFIVSSNADEAVYKPILKVLSQYV